jgi:hypothetical protein
VSREGFKEQHYLGAWHSFDRAVVSGPPMMRCLSLLGSFWPLRGGQPSGAETEFDHVDYGEEAFALPVKQIAEIIDEYQRNELLRRELPGWNSEQ